MKPVYINMMPQNMKFRFTLIELNTTRVSNFFIETRAVFYSKILLLLLLS